MQETAALVRRWVHTLSNEIGVRRAGSEQDRRAADFIEAEFGRIFPEVRRQEYRFLGWDPGGEGRLEIGGEASPTRLGIGCPPTPEGGVTGTLRPQGSSLYGLWEEEAAGPSAYLRLYTGPGGRAIPLLWKPIASVPVGIVDEALEDRLAAAAREGRPVTFSCRPELLPNIPSWNIEGILPGDPGRRVIVVAHYDTVYGSPGANDNAASCACLPALGQLLAAEPRADRPSLHFLATGSEEIDLQGARWYVQELLWRNEGDRVILAVNFDSLTWGNKVEVGVSDSAEEFLPLLRHALKTVRLSTYENRFERKSLSEGVDSILFHRAGLPTLNVNSSGDADTVRLWHTPDDTEERVPWPRVEDGVALFAEFLSRIG